MMAADAAAHTHALALEEWRREYPALRVRELEDRQCVYAAGDGIDDVYVVEQGYVVLSGGRPGEGGTMALLSRGDPFGPGLTGAAYAEESACANGPTRILRLPADAFRAAAARQPTYGGWLLRRLAARERLLLRRLEHLNLPSFRDRVLAGLIDLLEEHGETGVDGFGLRITKAQLADLCGSLRPHVSMVLHELKSAGLVQYTHERVCVTDYARLRRLRPGAGATAPA